MSEPNTQSSDQLILYLKQVLKQKDKIIASLKLKITDLQKQISIVTKDPLQNHQNQILYIEKKRYEQNAIDGKYLMVKVDGINGEGFWMQREAEIVDYREIYHEIYGREVNEEKQGYQNGKAIQIKAKKQNEGRTFSTSCRQLSLQIESLKKNMVIYSEILAKSRQKKSPSIHQQHEFTDNQGITIKQTESIIKNGNGSEIRDEKDNHHTQEREKDKTQEFCVSEFSNCSPVRKKNTKVVFIRK